MSELATSLDAGHARQIDRAQPVGMRAGLPLAARLAWRELRAGVSGFGVFIACIALGVAVITAVQTLGDALRSSFESQGEVLLGGDVALLRPHQKASGPERAWLERQGRLSEIATVRAMARHTAADEQALSEVKGIDAAYPLVGLVRFSNDVTTAQLLSGTGVAVEPILLERLKLKIGDTLDVGTGRFPVVALIENEPDKIGDRVNVGPRIFMSARALEQAGLADPGSLVTWRYALKIDAASGDDGALIKFQESLRSALPEAGFTVRDRRDPSPSISRTLDRLRQFLTLLGLTALIVGGVGVANAVATYIDRRRPIIAMFKSLGATSRFILQLHLVQVLTIAGIGIVIGLFIGVLVPIAIGALYGSALPIRADITIRPMSLALSMAYGFLVTLLFTLWPLGRAERIRPSELFREEVQPERVWPHWPVIVAIVGIAGLLLALAILGAEARRVATYFCAAVVGVLVLFYGLGMLVGFIARRLPRPRRPELALAIGNIGSPSGLSRAVVLSLGTGLSLLVAIALVDRSIVDELESRVPTSSPSYFVLDLKRDDLAQFGGRIRALAPDAVIVTAPMLRGRIVAVKGVPAEQVKVRSEQAWVLQGDRGLSYAATVPEGSRVVEGAWWTADYAGEPLVSVEVSNARGLGLVIGDQLTVNVLGRNVVVRVASLREVKWESLSLNFALVFSPNTLRNAPHNLLATITLPNDASLAEEAAIARLMGREFPSTTAIRVKDAIAQFNVLFSRIMTAVRAAASVTLLAGALVLAGALATAQRRRIKEAVILKVLGATRGRILRAHFVEYAMLALSTAGIAALVGTAAAYVTVVQVMKLPFVFSLPGVLQALGLALLMVCLFGGIGTWRVLAARPVPHLRSG